METNTDTDFIFCEGIYYNPFYPFQMRCVLAFINVFDIHKKNGEVKKNIHIEKDVAQYLHESLHLIKVILFFPGYGLKYAENCLLVSFS